MSYSNLKIGENIFSQESITNIYVSFAQYNNIHAVKMFQTGAEMRFLLVPLSKIINEYSWVHQRLSEHKCSRNEKK